MLCWHFSAAGKNSSTGVVPGMAEPGRKFQPCTGIKNKTAHWEWGLKTTGEEWACVCENSHQMLGKLWGSSSGAAQAGTEGPGPRGAVGAQAQLPAQPGLQHFVQQQLLALRETIRDPTAAPDTAPARAAQTPPTKTFPRAAEKLGLN